MTRTLGLALCMGFSWTGIAAAQYVSYPPVHIVPQPTVVQPVHHHLPLTHVRTTQVTSHPYHESIAVRRVAPAYGTADLQPMLPNSNGCNGNCMQVAMPPRSTVLQPVGVPSLGAYVPAAMPSPIPASVYPPAYPPANTNSVTEGYNIGRGLFGSPKFYRTGEPIRNMLRFLTL